MSTVQVEDDDKFFFSAKQFYIALTTAWTTGAISVFRDKGHEGRYTLTAAPAECMDTPIRLLLDADALAELLHELSGALLNGDVRQFAKHWMPYTKAQA